MVELRLLIHVELCRRGVGHAAHLIWLSAPGPRVYARDEPNACPRPASDAVASHSLSLRSCLVLERPAAPPRRGLCRLSDVEGSLQRSGAHDQETDTAATARRSVGTIDARRLSDGDPTRAAL